MAATGEEPREKADRLIDAMGRLRRLRVGMALPPDAGVSPAMMPIINHLAEDPGCSVRDLARALGLTTPTVSVSLRRLERQGLVMRRPHPRDNRAVRLFLTPAGEELHRRVREFRRQTAGRMLEGLKPQEQEELLRLLDKAISAAERRGEEPPSRKLKRRSLV
ncbi:MarR family winged helix-turn-helix transcriptional regulator [Oceanithermus sp.]